MNITLKTAGILAETCCKNIANKIYHRISKIILLVIYTFLDLINARKTEYITELNYNS